MRIEELDALGIGEEGAMELVIIGEDDMTMLLELLMLIPGDEDMPMSLELLMPGDDDETALLLIPGEEVGDGYGERVMLITPEAVDEDIMDVEEGELVVLGGL